MSLKKTALVAVMLLLCVAMTGCVTINVQYPASPAGQTVPEIIDAQASLFPNGGEASVSQGNEIIMTPTGEEDSDFAFDFGDLEWAWEGERTLQPATAADQIGGVQVDFAVDDANFEAQIDELAYYSDEYLGKNISLLGYVLHYEAPQPDTQFAIVREIMLPEEEMGEHLDEIDPETGELLEDYSHDPYLTGFDCHFVGEVPADGAWMRVVGTLSEYVYTDPESGEQVPMLMLDLLHMEPAPAQA